MKKMIFLFLLFSGIFSIESQEAISTSKSKKIYYRDSIISVQKWYNNNKKLDSLKTYFKTGEVLESFYYNNGRYQGSSYKYNKGGEKVTTWLFENGKLIKREDHIIEFNKKNEKKIKALHIKLKKINDSVTIHPNKLNFLHQRASIRNKLGNFTLALNDYSKVQKAVIKISKAKKIKPSKKLLANIYDAKGSIYGYMEMKNHASHNRYMAVIVAPEDNRLKFNLASYLYTIKSYRLSLHYLDEVLKEWKGHAFSHRLLAAIYTDLEDFEKAKHHIDLAFPKEKNLIKFGSGKLERDIRTLRGFISHNLGQSEIGIADLKEAIRLNEDNSFAHRNLGAVYYDLGKYKMACDHLQKAKNLDYEKTHDRDDLHAYLELSCKNAEALEQSISIKKTPPKIIKLADKPFVYPNPGKDIINVKNFPHENFNYEIYNFLSKLVLKNTTLKSSLNISSLPQGVYILRIYNEKSIKTFRIVKE